MFHVLKLMLVLNVAELTLNIRQSAKQENTQDRKTKFHNWNKNMTKKKFSFRRFFHSVSWEKYFFCNYVSHFLSFVSWQKKNLLKRFFITWTKTFLLSFTCKKSSKFFFLLKVFFLLSFSEKKIFTCQKNKKFGNQSDKKLHFCQKNC